MAGSLVSDDELKTLLVDQMELVDAAEFEKAQQMSSMSVYPGECAGRTITLQSSASPISSEALMPGRPAGLPRRGRLARRGRP